MAWKNSQYHGPDIMIRLMRATNIPWQQTSMRNGYLISNAQYRERRGHVFAPLEADTEFGHLSERELRNLHSQSSRRTRGAFNAPHSKYVSLTNSSADTSWGEGRNPTIIFRFDIWRSDVWKGNHDLTRDPALHMWLMANILAKPPAVRTAILSTQTPADWDRGMEFEWLALGGTKIYNVEESSDGTHWNPAASASRGLDFWWEALPG